MTAHFSLDIETLDTRATAVVVSVGICKFDPEAVDAVGPIEHVSLEVGVQVRNNRTISSDTFYWWAQELVKMGKSPFPQPYEDVESGLSRIINFIYANSEAMEPKGDEPALYQDACLWVRGPHFDWTIVDNLAGQVGVAWPIRYDKVLDQRTFCKGETYDPPESGETFVKHDALGDAIMQALFIQQVTKKRAAVEALAAGPDEEMLENEAAEDAASQEDTLNQ